MYINIVNLKKFSDSISLKCYKSIIRLFETKCICTYIFYIESIFNTLFGRILRREKMLTAKSYNQYLVYIRKQKKTAAIKLKLHFYQCLFSSVEHYLHATK